MNLSLLSKIDSRVFSLIKILLAVCLATPLLMSASFIFPYTAPKAFAFRILVELAIVGYLYLALKYPDRFLFSIFCHSRHQSVIPAKAGIQVESEPGSRIKPRMTIGVVILVFLAANLFSAIFGADFYASWWGNLERMGGVWSLMHFSAWFFMLVGVFKTKQDWRNLLKVSVAVSSLISLLAIGQHFFSLGDLLPQVGRVYAALGNAGVLGSYLIFNIFLAGYLAISKSPSTRPAVAELAQGIKKILPERSEAKSKAIRISYWLLLIINCMALALTGTRGAWLGLLAGVIIFLILSFFTPFSSVIPVKTGIQNPGSRIKSGMTNKKKKLAFILLATIFILIGLLFISRDLAFIQNNAVLSRLTSFSVSDATTQSRLLLWQGAWQAWQEKPMLGWGPENFELAASKYLSPQLASLEAYSTDRAHNFIFDYGVATGWLGLASYLAMIGAAALTLWRWRKNDLIFFAVFGSLLLAYLAQNIFIFDSFISYLMLFFVLALIVGNDFIAGEAGRNNSQSKMGVKEIRLPFFRQLIFLFAVICLLLSVYCFNLKPILAAHYAEQILSLPASEAEQAGPLLESVVALKTFALPEIAYQASLDYIDKIGQNPALAQNEKFYDIASLALNELIIRFPGRVKNYIALSWLDLYFSGFNSQRVEEAISLGNKIKEMSPNKKDAYFILVASYALIVQPQKAQEVISQAEKIDAKIGEEVKNYYDKLK